MQTAPSGSGPFCRLLRFIRRWLPPRQTCPHGSDRAANASCPPSGFSRKERRHLRFLSISEFPAFGCAGERAHLELITGRRRAELSSAAVEPAHGWTAAHLTAPGSGSVRWRWGGHRDCVASVWGAWVGHLLAHESVYQPGCSTQPWGAGLFDGAQCVGVIDEATASSAPRG